MSAIISKIDFSTVRSILQFSYSINKATLFQGYKLTKHEEVFYGLNEVEELSLSDIYNRRTRSEQSIYKE